MYANLCRSAAALAAFLLVGSAACASSGSYPLPEPEGELVSDGYTTTDRDRVSGAISSIDPGELRGLRADNVAALLQGRVAGLVVTRRGNGYSMRIRGANSIIAQGEPLIVIDGLPLDQRSGMMYLATMSTTEVARIDVLKDAGSTALYGSRGVNGVIVVTTKRAQR